MTGILSAAAFPRRNTAAVFIVRGRRPPRGFPVRAGGNALQEYRVSQSRPAGRFSPRLRALRCLSAISAALRRLHDCGVYAANSTDKRLFRRFTRGATAGGRRVRRVCRRRAAGKDRECGNIFSGVTKSTTKINFRKNILFFLLLRVAPRFKPFNVLLIIINQLLAPYGRTYNFCVLLSMRARLRTRCGHRSEVV